jgi:signal transduction histidine kinase/ActR/RegA family two-component response regulator
VTIVDEHDESWRTEQVVASAEANTHIEPTFSSLSGRANVPQVLADAIDRALASGSPVFLPFPSPQASEVNGKPFAFRSIFAMSLRARGRTLGAVTLALGPSGRDLDLRDQALAEDLVGRAAVVIDNARLYRDIQESDRHKNEFLAMLAHELRNPLAPIRNAVQVLKMPNTDSTHQQWASDVIARQVEQMVRLVDDLLDVSRITRGKIQLQSDLVDVAAVVARAVETSRPLIESRKHDLTVELPTEPLYAKADPTRLAQVLANLLNNAAKYTEEGGRIALSAAREENDIVFRVRDNGIGIVPEMLGRVFDLFTQAERAIDRSQGGLGIGLTLVRRLVELHDGTVQAFSAGVGEGSEFVVRLPAPSGATPKAKRHPSKDVASQTSACFRILIVDDNVDGAESLAVVLRTFGQEVQTVYDGPAALSLAETFHPQIVLLDIGLPGLNGYEVAKRLRAKENVDKPLLVAVTGYGQKEDRLTARRAGFDHHLVKPVVGDTLPALLTSLYKKKGRREWPPSESVNHQTKGTST